MTLELHDTDSFNGNINAGASETLSVQTSKADAVEVLLDNGTSGTAPASYDIQVDYYSTAVDDWMRADEVTASTSFAPPVEESARGQQYRVTITNQSGAAADYRVSLEAYKEI